MNALYISHKLWPTMAGSFAGMYPAVCLNSIRRNEQGTRNEGWDD
jgi:hypothetical protein